eukprot:TRINITY_DN3132_c0_g1_i1.p1 TRINITY_DN3132_c0_g1~~TRINITY_DN3132_c0_g1_i1.p1  ORF type:complete len:140 (+),score=29.89 TRINITY_DN3132_c0_g1_i1:61-420(+)
MTTKLTKEIEVSISLSPSPHTPHYNLPLSHLIQKSLYFKTMFNPQYAFSEYEYNDDKYHIELEDISEGLFKYILEYLLYDHFLLLNDLVMDELVGLYHMAKFFMIFDYEGFLVLDFVDC